MKPTWPVLMVVGAVVAATASPASAFSGGIATESFPNPPTACNFCHSGGITPTVTLSGPTSVDPGSTNTYTVTVSNPGTQTSAGLNVSAADGTFALAAPGPDAANTKTITNFTTSRLELTHTAPKAGAGGPTTFSFDWTAPLSFGSVTLNAWGNAVNGNGNFSGDKAAMDALVVSNSTPVPTPTPICAATPRPCQTPEVSSLVIKNPTVDSKDKVIFQWKKGPTLDAADFGSPTSTTSMALCVYSDDTLVFEVDAPAAGVCNPASGAPCWKAVGSAPIKGYKYRDKELTPNGMASMALLRGSIEGRARIKAKGKGAGLDLPDSLPFGGATLVHAQVVNSENANCWGESYDGSEILTNSPDAFKARN